MGGDEPALPGLEGSSGWGSQHCPPQYQGRVCTQGKAAFLLGSAAFQIFMGYSAFPGAAAAGSVLAPGLCWDAMGAMGRRRQQALPNLENKVVFFFT